MKARLTLIAGLALYWPLLTGQRVAIQSYASTETMARVLAIVYFGVIAVIALLLATLFRNRVSHILAYKRPILTIGIASSTFLLPGALAPSSVNAVTATICLTPAILCSALSFCVLQMAWGSASLSPGYEHARKTFAVDAVLSFVLGYALLSIGLDAATRATSSDTFRRVVQAFYPTLSSTLLFLFPNSGIPRSDQESHRLCSSQSVAKLLAISLFIMLASVLISIFASISSSSDYVTNSGCLLCSALFIPLVYVSERYPRLRLIAWGSVLLLVFSGATVALVAEESVFDAGYDFIIVGRLVIWTMLWIVTVETAKREHRDPALLVCIFCVGMRGISCVLTDSLKLVPSIAVIPDSDFNPIVLIVELLLVACSFVVIGLTASFPIQHGENMAEAQPPEALAETTRHAVCLDLAEEYGLTEREAVTLEYLSLGNTMQRIADAQYVSQNTVRTHTKSIYRKMGRHSKQEVIDLVNNRLRSEDH